MSRRLTRQLALPLAPDKRKTLNDDYLITPCNAPIHQQLLAWHNWPYHCAILSGPAASGKTSMGNCFAASGAGYFVDQADGQDQEQLFHLWNRAQYEGVALLMASSKPYPQWQLSLPDLKSRLGAAQMLAIASPDLEMIGLLLEKQMLQRGALLSDYKARYAALRLPRCYQSTIDFAHRLDRLALERGEAINLEMIRQLLAEPEMLAVGQSEDDHFKDGQISDP